jgi:photosystem II stability/assembly factor-like uncharacterized protein
MSSTTDAWTSVNSGNGTIADMSFAPSTTTGWAVGNNGLIVRSTDGGDTWNVHACAICGTQNLNSVSAVTASLVFVGGSSGQIYRWNGSIWEALPVLSPAMDPKAIDSPDGSTLWVATASGHIYKGTGVGGAVGSVAWTHWQPTTNSFNGIDAVSANVMFAVGDMSTIARTTNGGGDLAITTIAAGSLRDVAATSSTVAVAVSSGGQAVETTTGTTWNTRGTGSFEMVDEVERSGNTVFAVTEYGRVLTSANGGVTWGASAVQTKTTGPLTSVAIVDANTIVVGGIAKNIQRSVDAGATWNFEYVNAPATEAIAAVDASEAFAVGDSGTIYRSTDGGVNWTTQTSNVTQTLHAVTATGTAGDRLIAVGDAGAVTTTTNGGTTWTPGSSGTTQRLRGVSMWGDSYAWAVGDNGTILRSTNGGTSWSAQTSGTTLTLYAVKAASKDVAWAVGGTDTGSTRIILATTDGGATWTTQLSAAGNPIVAVDAVSTTRAMALGFSGRVYMTTDGGATWPSVNTGSGRAFALSMGSEDVAFISLYDTVYRSDDFGATWSAATGVNWRSYHGLDAVDPDTAWGITGNHYTGTLNGGAAIPDYGAAPNSWAQSSAGLFGVCLQSVGAGTSAVWTPDTSGVSGQCEAADTDPWRALPTAPSKVATAPQGTTGRANFVFGFRPASAQAPGSYYASVTFEALAPAV